MAEKGFGPAHMAEMQKIIDAEKSDLYDVLAYVAFAMPTLTREERASAAKAVIHSDSLFSEKQQAFLDFVLGHYVNEGVHELDQQKLNPLLRLRYQNSLSDAFAELGPPDVVRLMFAGFQKYLYQRRRTA